MDEHGLLAEQFEAHRTHLREWPTGCSARSTRRTTPFRSPGRGKIVEIALLADPARLRELDLEILDD